MNCYKIGSYVDGCGNSNRKSCRKVLFKLEPGYIYYENCIKCSNKLGIIFDSDEYFYPEYMKYTPDLQDLLNNNLLNLN